MIDDAQMLIDQQATEEQELREEARESWRQYQAWLARQEKARDG